MCGKALPINLHAGINTRGVSVKSGARSVPINGVLTRGLREHSFNAKIAQSQFSFYGVHVIAEHQTLSPNNIITTALDHEVEIRSFSFRCVGKSTKIKFAPVNFANWILPATFFGVRRQISAAVGVPFIVQETQAAEEPYATVKFRTKKQANIRCCQILALTARVLNHVVGVAESSARIQQHAL